MIGSYHNHSTWSDGKAPLDQIVAHARSLGLDELGLSDHYTLHPSGRPIPWAMPPDRVSEYVQQLVALREQSRGEGGLVVRVGLEVDWFTTQAEVIRTALAALPLDHVIGSVHFVRDLTIDGSRTMWQRLTEAQRDEIYRDYWRLIREMADSRLFDIAAHLDLPKKFGFPPKGDVSHLIAEALDAIAEASMVVELNTSGWHSPCGDAYPTLEILEQCRQRDIAVMLSADAHQPEHLLRNFAAGAQRLMDAGYEQVARFAGREIRFEPIATAVPVD